MNFKIRTSRKDEVVDITDEVSEIVSKSEKKNGVVVLNVLHTTCALTTADLDPGTDEDILEALRKILPKISYRHPHDPSHVGDHILSSIVGTSLSIIFEDGELKLGTWQRLILIELNGPREREISFVLI